MCNIVYFMLTGSPSYMSALAFYSKPLHNRFIVTKEEVSIQLTSQWSCMCVLGVYMFAFFYNFCILISEMFRLCGIFFLHFIVL